MRSQELMDSALADCTDAQREAIAHVNGPLLVLAGPGSGKTRVITRRIAHLVGTGCRADEILAITFTNKAAGEMRERVAALGALSGVWALTFHSFCARALRMYGRRIGLQPSFSIYDQADSASAVKRVMKDLNIDASLYKPAALVRAVSAAKNRMQTPEQVASGRSEDAETVAKVYRKYAEVLRNNNAADFDDLLMLTVKLLTEVPAARDRLRDRFRHVLIDEYQDTNHAQYLIAKHLAAGHRNICATGDPDQSIYGWRGADIGNILEFEQDYPDAKVVRLEQNYRSTKRILQAADKLIVNNLARKPKSLWTENPEGDTVRLFCCEDEREEADRVADEIAGLIGKKEAVPRDIAVFYRTNAQTRVLEASLRGGTIPYTIVAGTEFYQRKEIKDLMAYLRLVVNPADDVAAERVANVPARRVGDASVRKLREWGERRGRSLLAAMGRAREAGVRGPALRGIERFLAVLSALRAMPQTEVVAIVERLIEITEYPKYLESSFDNAAERIENIEELVNAAADYRMGEPEGDLAGFLEQAALVSDTDRWDEKKGAVTLMTLHAAKGLEFPVVFIVGLEDGLLPLAREEFIRDLEEERRLFFVGITRAKRRLFLSYAESRMRFGRTDYTEPSRFLSELPDDVAEERIEPAPSGPAVVGGATSGALFRTSRAATRRFEPRRVKRGATEEIVYDGDQPSDEWVPPFHQGDQVVHPTYGRGKVVDIRGYADSAMAVVRFHSVGVKKLVLKFARMRQVGD